MQSANLAAVWERSMQKLPCIAAASAAEKKKKQQKECEREGEMEIDDAVNKREGKATTTIERIAN